MGTSTGLGNLRRVLVLAKCIFPSGPPPQSANPVPMTFAEIERSLPGDAVTSIETRFPRIASGKVREIFDLGDSLLLVASDRLSAFDVILPDGIPGKGIVLTQLSNWWFAQTEGIIANHLLPDQPGEFARRGLRDRDLQ